MIAIFNLFIVVYHMSNLSESKTKKVKNIKKEIEEEYNDEELTRLDKLKPGRRNFS